MPPRRMRHRPTCLTHQGFGATQHSDAVARPSRALSQAVVAAPICGAARVGSCGGLACPPQWVGVRMVRAGRSGALAPLLWRICRNTVTAAPTPRVNPRRAGNPGAAGGRVLLHSLPADALVRGGLSQCLVVALGPSARSFLMLRWGLCLLALAQTCVSRWRWMRSVLAARRAVARSWCASTIVVLSLSALVVGRMACATMPAEDGWRCGLVWLRPPPSCWRPWWASLAVARWGRACAP